jgi:hypothetical protein
MSFIGLASAYTFGMTLAVSVTTKLHTSRRYYTPFLVLGRLASYHVFSLLEIPIRSSVRIIYLSLDQGHVADACTHRPFRH